jgi:hypothetical protein
MTDLEKLIEMYQQMSDLTAPECAHTCMIPHHCCQAAQCEDTINFAQRYYGVTLARTTHPRLPLMSPSGCTAAPHLRPVCTVHTCDVNSFAGKFDRKTSTIDKEWTLRYFKLRDEIDQQFNAVHAEEAEKEFNEIMEKLRK